VLPEGQRVPVAAGIYRLASGTQGGGAVGTDKLVELQRTLRRTLGRTGVSTFTLFPDVRHYGA
jgi:hypothetical protein